MYGGIALEWVGKATGAGKKEQQFPWKGNDR